VYHHNLVEACEKALVWSPDGKQIAFGSPKGVISIWTFSTSRLVAYRVHQSQVDALAWSPAGNTLASACGNQVQLWSPQDDAQYARLARFSVVPGEPVRALSWSPDGASIAVAQKGNVQVRGVGERAEKRVPHKVYDSFGNAAAVEAVAWSPAAGQKGNLVASASDKKVEIWDVETGKVLLMYEHPDNQVVNSLAWSPDGRYLASASDLFGVGSVQVWDTTADQLRATYEKPRSIVHTLAWSPLGKREGASSQPYLLASGGNDACVRIWDALTEEKEVVYEGHKDEVTVVAWSPDGKYIASGSRDKTIHIWQAG
jgi:eukaryotic-like serine/threonine-protein kinase